MRQKKIISVILAAMLLSVIAVAQSSQLQPVCCVDRERKG